MKKILGIVLAVIVVAVIIGAVSGSGSDGTKPPQQPDPSSNAAFTAITSAPKWAAFTAKCTEPAVALAGEVQVGYNDLQRHDQGESYSALVKHLNHSIPPSIAPTRCDSIIAAYLVIREPS